MKLLLFLFTGLALCEQIPGISDDATRAKAYKQRYVDLTDSWANDIEFTKEEQAAMDAGKPLTETLLKGPADPIAKRILDAGEPSWASVSALYPGKILDRTILGTWSDPAKPLGKYVNEFAIYWNGAIAANLIHGRLTNRLGATGTQPLAHNTVVEFRVGPSGELPGRVRRNYSSLGYEKGYLPIVRSTYTVNGVNYRETAFAWQRDAETAGWDVAYVAFDIVNNGSKLQPAVLSARIVLTDQTSPQLRDGSVVDAAGAILVAPSDGATFGEGRLEWRFNLQPKESRRVVLKIPYLPDRDHKLRRPTLAEFDAVHREAAMFWQGLLDRGANIQTPEPRINNAWRALLLQNFVLADGPRFTYGSGLRYNDSTYPQENGFGTHVFAMLGHKQYANALQEWFPQMCVTPQGAGRKYQNRRAMVFHHLLENYRLTGFTDLFERHKADYLRIAEEIIQERRSATAAVTGEKPWHYGLLPPDKPGVDVQASTQTVYVLGHNITNAQGLTDLGHFLTLSGIDRERGQRYLREAADFREAIATAMKRAAIRVPGRPPFVDLQTLYFRQTPDFGPEPYDDLGSGRLQGAYYHYWVDMQFHYNFFNPGDEIGQWLADYVHEVNGFVLGLTRARPLSNELGWVNNVYDAGYYNYRLRRGEIPEFLLGLYSKLAFGMSRYTYVAAEGNPFVGHNTSKGGFVSADYSVPNSAANADWLLMLRNALVLEELENNIETGKLSILKGAPAAWLGAGKTVSVDRLATYFGDISYRTEATADRVGIAIDPPQGAWREIEVSVRRPVNRVTVNGKRHTNFDPAGFIRLPRTAGPVRIEAWF